MEIPLVSETEVQKEDSVGKDIRNDLIEFLKIKGYRYIPSEEGEDETVDFFVKEEQLIQLVINNGIPEEIIEQMEKTDQ